MDQTYVLRCNPRPLKWTKLWTFHSSVSAFIFRNTSVYLWRLFSSGWMTKNEMPSPIVALNGRKPYSYYFNCGKK